MKNLIKTGSLLVCILILLNVQTGSAQQLKMPAGDVNYVSMNGRKVGNTDIEIKWNAPGVKGREGKIWGTQVAPYGFEVLGFGSNVRSPWRAGADESTTISFSTDVTINGQKLAAGTYGFFIALYPDSCTLIFNKNTHGWGAYFYNENLDALRVKTIQKKNQNPLKERIEYNFSNHTKNSIDIALDWEHWSIPFTVETDLTATTLASIQAQLSGGLGFDPPSLESGALWCLQNNVNLEQALGWINAAVDPNLGGVQNFKTSSTKAGLLSKLGRSEEADKIMKTAMESASANELHAYGRQLLGENKTKQALEVFQKNYSKHNGAWPTAIGLMRGYSAMGDYKKALEYAKMALPQSPNEETKKYIQSAIATLESGKPL